MKTYLIRTVDSNGDYIERAQEADCYRAGSLAELLSEKTVYGNAIITNTKTRQMWTFINGRIT